MKESPPGPPTTDGPTIPSSKAILGLAEIVLNVADLGAAQQFYTDIVGLTLHHHWPEVDPTIVFLTITDTATPLGRNHHPQLLALIDARRHVFSRDTYQGLDPARSQLNHIAFEVRLDSLISERQRLIELGIEVEPAEFPAMSARAIFFKDPEGNTLEFIAYDPAVTGSKPFLPGL